MKTETKKVTKVTKVTKKSAVDYKEMYESLKKYSDDVAEELDYYSDLSFDRGALIDDMTDTIHDLNEEIDSLKNWCVALSFGFFSAGLLLGLYF
jgi:hypothetical protein